MIFPLYLSKTMHEEGVNPTYTGSSLLEVKLRSTLARRVEVSLVRFQKRAEPALKESSMTNPTVSFLSSQ